MVSTTITFDKDHVQPPVFVAGGFTEWAPVEMTCETTEANGSLKHVFSYRTELEPGEYQYKFRLGPGDWWVLDESAQKATDELGNVNNVLSVETEERKAPSEPPAEAIPTPLPRVLNTKDAYIMEDEPTVNGSANHEHSSQPYPPPEEVVSKLVDSHTPKQPAVDVQEPMAETEKQGQFNQQAGKESREIVTPRSESIPDFAPPPYSVSATGAVQESGDKVQVAPVAEAGPQKQPAKPAANEDESEQKKQSLGYSTNHTHILHRKHKLFGDRQPFILNQTLNTPLISPLQYHSLCVQWQNGLWWAMRPVGDDELIFTFRLKDARGWDCASKQWFEQPKEQKK